MDANIYAINWQQGIVTSCSGVKWSGVKMTIKLNSNVELLSFYVLFVYPLSINYDYRTVLIKNYRITVHHHALPGITFLGYVYLM